MSIFEHLKKINPLNLDSYLQDSWQLTYEQGIDLTYHYVKKLINRILIEDHIKKRWLILNDKYRDAFLSNIRIHLFRTYTGSGKTVTSVMWVKFLTQLSSKIEGFVVLSAEYEHGTKEIEKIIIKHGNQVNYVYFSGKNRLCTQQLVKINKKGTTIAKLMKYGISIEPYCINECPDLKKDKCQYKCNCSMIIAPIEKGGIKNWIGVQHQIGCFLPIFMYHVNDIFLIIDENFTDAIKEHYRFGKKVLQKNLDFLKLLLKDLKPDIDENYRYFIEQFRDLLSNFIQSLYTHLTPLNYEKIGEILDNIDTAKGIDDTYLKKLNYQLFNFVKNGKIKPFKFIFDDLCNFIDNYEELLESNYEDIDNWMRASFYKKQDKYEITFLYYDKCKLDTLFKRDNLSKLIINDATANKIELSYLIGDKEPVIEHNEDWMYENCEFHQLRKPITNYKNFLKNDKNKLDKSRKYAHYPKTSMLHKNTFFYLMNDLKIILQKHKDEPVLVVAREVGDKEKDMNELKPINDGINLSKYVKMLGHPNVIFEDYPLEGTNAYSDINVIVVLGKPDLPNATIKRQSTLIGMEHNVYRDMYSRRNMIQAIGRIMRGGNKKYVYILSGFDLLLNRPITYYKSHTDLQNNILREIKEKENKKQEEKEINTLLTYIKKNKFITSKKYTKMYNISSQYARKKLNLLVKKNIIKARKEGTNEKIFYV